MPTAYEGTTVRMPRTCPQEDAVPLSAWLCAVDNPQVDLSECEDMHPAVLQCLLAFEPSVVGMPSDAFLRQLLHGLRCRL